MSQASNEQAANNAAFVIFMVIAAIIALMLLPLAIIGWSLFVILHSSQRKSQFWFRLIWSGIGVGLFGLIGYQILSDIITTSLAGNDIQNTLVTGLIWGGTWAASGLVWLWAGWLITRKHGREVAPYFWRTLDFIFGKPGLRKDHIKGMRLIDLTGKRVPKWLRDAKTMPPTSLGWVPYPSLETETQHTQIEGGTGTGKSQAIKCLSFSALARGDCLIAIDSGSDLFKTFSEISGDTTRIDIMEPDCPAKWSPLNEIERPADWAHLATGLIGQGSGDSAEWRAMAKALFASVGEGYAKACVESGREFSNREFYDLLIAAPDDALAPFVQGTSAAALIGNQKGISSIRMSLLEPLAFFKYLPDSPCEANFSARKWMRETMQGYDEPQSLFLTFKKRDLPTTRNLIAGLIDLLISTAVDEGKSDRRIWLVIDELAGLGEIPALLMGAAELRKTGVRLVIGMQDYDQIENIYGRSRAASITNNLSNKLVLGTSNPTAAERLSKMLGEQRVLMHGRTENQSKNFFAGSGTEGTSQTEREERIVMASEIQSLPRLVGFCKMAGSDTVYKTPVPVFG